MSIFVFMGPTLEVEEARGVLDATYLPPASQGDVFRIVATTDARVVGIIDGNFQEVPSVWHKELLWAMSQGVYVLGAASMGALRATELADFGMVGVGRIFEAYLAGVLEPYGDVPFEDDDEVAIVHGPAELGYRPLSEALVDIRCTLDLASREHVVSPASRDRLANLAKSCFYAERSYETLLDLGASTGCAPRELQSLRDWLPCGRISQKKQDALALLARISALDLGNSKEASFDFQHTTMWDNLTAEAFARQPITAETDFAAEELAVLAELRLQPDEFLTVKEAADWKLRIGPCPPVWRVALTMLSVLRSNGRYAGFATRAARKRSWLADHDMPRAGDLTGLQALQLLDWYFGRRLGRDMPDDVEAFARSLGNCDRKALVDALLLEYAFVTSGACSDRS